MASYSFIASEYGLRQAKMLAAPAGSAVRSRAATKKQAASIIKVAAFGRPSVTSLATFVQAKLSTLSFAQRRVDRANDTNDRSRIRWPGAQCLPHCDIARNFLS